jgi:sugar phosphate permease
MRVTRWRQRYLIGLGRDVKLLAFTSLWADISSEMLFPMLPIFLTTVLGAPVSAVGVMEGAATGIQYGVQGPVGWLADRLGRKKPLAVAGYVLAALGKLLIGLAVVWPVAVAGRALDRLGTGTRSAPRDALIAAAAPDEQRGAAFGLEGLGDNAGAFLGPLLALLLVSVLHTSLRLVFL